MKELNIDNNKDLFMSDDEIWERNLNNLESFIKEYKRKPSETKKNEKFSGVSKNYAL